MIELAACNRYYGHGAVIRSEGAVPSWLPLPFAIQHGWLYGTLPHERAIEIVAGTPTIWAWTPEDARGFAERGGKPFVGGAPIVYAASLAKKTEQPRRRRGTLAYPLHGTPFGKLVGDFEGYADELEKLPEQFQPVVICLHFSDLGTEQQRIFERRGFEIVCNGAPHDPEFLFNFIANVRRFRFATSNEMTPALLYAAFLDVPGFVHGPTYRYEKHIDPYGLKGDFSTPTTPCMEQLGEIFSRQRIDDAEAQKRVARKELGADYQLSGEAISQRVTEGYKLLRPLPLVRGIGWRLHARWTRFRSQRGG